MFFLQNCSLGGIQIKKELFWGGGGGAALANSVVGGAGPKKISRFEISRGWPLCIRVVQTLYPRAALFTYLFFKINFLYFPFSLKD